MLPSFAITVKIPLSTVNRNTWLIGRSIVFPSLKRITRLIFSNGSGCVALATAGVRPRLARVGGGVMVVVPVVDGSVTAFSSTGGVTGGRFVPRRRRVFGGVFARGFADAALASPILSVTTTSTFFSGTSLDASGFSNLASVTGSLVSLCEAVASSRPSETGTGNGVGVAFGVTATIVPTEFTRIPL